MIRIVKKTCALGLFSMAFCFTACAAPNEQAKQCETSANLNYEATIVFAERLQKYVRSYKRKQVAQMVEYPLRVNLSSEKHIVVNNQKEFLEAYNTIITKQVRKNIINARAQALFCNSQGAMLASGTLWFRSVSNNPKQISLYVINSNA